MNGIRRFGAHVQLLSVPGERGPNDNKKMDLSCFWSVFDCFSGIDNLMIWQDVPLRAINFSSFWLTNFADAKLTLNELLYLTVKNKFNIEKENLLKIVEEMVSSGIVDCQPRREPDFPARVSMIFFLVKDKTEALIADFKKDNATL
jgi:hypothetical protein